QITLVVPYFAVLCDFASWRETRPPRKQAVRAKAQSRKVSPSEISTPPTLHYLVAVSILESVFEYYVRPVYRRRTMKRLVATASLVLIVCSLAVAQPRGTSESRTSTISEKTAGMQRFAGYFPFYWDAKAGKVWLEIDKWNSEFLYVESLSAGVGSNDLGL